MIRKPAWHWQPFDPKYTSLSGDISKLFRNDIAGAPGLLAKDAPHPNASLLARGGNGERLRILMKASISSM